MSRLFAADTKDDQLRHSDSGKEFLEGLYALKVSAAHTVHISSYL